MQVRDAFANASSAFSSCSVEHSRPVTFCQACVTQYIDVLHSYRNMSEVGIEIFRKYILIFKLIYLPKLI